MKLQVEWTSPTHKPIAGGSNSAFRRVAARVPDAARVSSIKNNDDSLYDSIEEEEFWV